MDQPQSPNPTMELLEQGLTVMRVENETLQAMAIQRPRDIARLSTSALEELRAFPQFAEKMYYSIPYKDRSGPEEKTVFVEGPSIKAANALARQWGNNSTGFRIIGSDEERVTIQGVFIDHETGMRRTAEISVSRKAKTRKGETYTLPVDRLNIAIQAGGSKAVRNAINNALPIGLVESYFAEAKRLAARGGRNTAETPDVDMANIAAQVEKCLAAFETRGVERAEVSGYIARHAELSDEEKVAAHLVGLLNGIEEGAINIEEVFTAPDTALTAPQATAPAPAAAPKPAKALPADRRRLQAKLDSATCESCRKPIKKGQWIWKDPAYKNWVHEVC